MSKKEKNPANTEFVNYEQLKHKFLNEAPVIIAFHNKEHELQWANKAYLNATGLSLSKIKGQKCYHVWGLDKHCENCPVIEAIKTGEPEEAELTPENQKNWPDEQGSWLIRAKPVRDEKGNIVGAIEVAFDITERKQAEEHLKKSEAKYRELFNSAFVGITVHDSEGNIIAANSKSEEVFGIKEKHLKEKSVDFWTGKLFKPSGKPMKVSDFPISVAAESKSPQEGNMLGLSMSGDKKNIRWFLHSARPILEDNGEIDKVVTSFIDITARKEAEKKVRENERFLQNVFDGIQDGISVLDKDLNILRVNQWMKKMYSHKLPLEGKKCYQVYQDRESRCPWCPSIKTLRTGEKETVEVPYPSEKKQEGWIALSSFPIKKSSGEVTGVIEHVKDITEQKEAMKKIEHLNSLLKSIISINQIIVKGDNLRDIMKKVVKSLVKNRPYLECAISLLDDEKGKISPVAEAGEHKLIKDWEITPDGTGYAPECVRKAIRDNSVKIINTKDCKDCEFRKTKKSHLTITIPIQRNRNIVGVLHIGFEEGREIYDEEKKLLIESAEDLAFARDKLLAEKKLEESEHKFRSLVNQAAEMLFLHKTDGTIVDVNQTAIRHTGYEREELLGMNVFDIDPDAEDREDRKKYWEGLSPEDEAVTFETRHHRKDGSIYPAEITVSKVILTDGEYILALARDITDRKEAEEELRESRKKYRSLFYETPLGTFHYDENGVITECNEKFIEIIGSSKDALIGLDMLNKLKDKKMISEVKSSLKEGMGYYEGNYSSVTSDKTTPVRVLLKGIRNEQGEIYSGMGLVEDITERKEAEEKLKYSERKFRSIFEASPDPTFLLDENGVFKDINKKVIEKLGFERDEIIDVHITETPFLSEKSKEKAMDKLEQRKRGKTIPPYELELTRKDGKQIYAEINANMFEGEDFTGEIVIARDITAQKEAEEELMKMEKLESLGVLAGGIAHDFNNLLTGILGNVSLVKMEVDEEVEEMLKDVEKAAKKARKLTDQLLTFSKGGEPVKEKTSIKEIIKESAEFVLHGSNSRCIFNFPDDLWKVNVDEGQISQVINNLIINSDQAMPEGGEIKIKAENIVLEEDNSMHLDEGKYVKVKISDEGIGISQEHQKKIFDPYFSTKSKGSGLGLATVYSIIKKHGGHISVYSEIGKGTTFYFYLPADTAEIKRKKTEKKIESFTGSGRILLMDDKEIVRDVLIKMLESRGYRVESAEDGEEAVEKYKKALNSDNPFDAVILDLTVPGGMGGKEAIKKLKEINPDVKAVVSSGYSQDPVMSNYREHGFSAFIEKPFSSKKLDETLAELFG